MAVTLVIVRRADKIAKSNNFFMSVRLSHIKQLRSHWKDFHKILYLCIFRKSVEKIQVSLKSDQNNR
jgi:hypothetical protein